MGAPCVHARNGMLILLPCSTAPVPRSPADAAPVGRGNEPLVRYQKATPLSEAYVQSRSELTQTNARGGTNMRQETDQIGGLKKLETDFRLIFSCRRKKHGSARGRGRSRLNRCEDGRSGGAGHKLQRAAAAAAAASCGTMLRYAYRGREQQRIMRGGGGGGPAAAPPRRFGGSLLFSGEGKIINSPVVSWYMRVAGIDCCVVALRVGHVARIHHYRGSHVARIITASGKGCKLHFYYFARDARQRTRLFGARDRVVQFRSACILLLVLILHCCCFFSGVWGNTRCLVCRCIDSHIGGGGGDNSCVERLHFS